MREILIPITIEPLEEGGYLATSPVWEDLLAQGRTMAETLKIAQDVARKLIESYFEHGDPLPEVIRRIMAQTQISFNTQIPIPVSSFNLFFCKRSSTLRVICCTCGSPSRP